MATKAELEFTAKDRASRVIQNIKGELTGLSAVGARVGGIIGPLGGIATAAGIIGGASVIAIKNFVGAIDDLEDTAAGLGVTTLALAEMRSKAAEAGVGAEVLDQGLARLNKRLAEARAGSREDLAIFKSLDIDVRQIRDTEDALQRIADRFSTYAAGANKGALAAELFGDRAGRKFIAYLDQGSGGLRQFTGLTEDSIREASKLQAEIDKLGTSWERFKNTLLGAAVPAINRVIEVMGSASNEAKLRTLENVIADLEQRGGKSAANLERYRASLAKLKAEIRGASFDAADPLAVRQDAPAPAKAQAEGAKAAEAFLERLKKQVATQNLNEFAALRVEAAQLKVGAAAEKYIAILQKARVEQAAIASAIKAQEADLKRANDLAAAQQGYAGIVEDVREQGDAIALTRLEYDKLAVARRIDRQAAEDAARFADDDIAQAIIHETAERRKREAVMQLESNAAAALGREFEALIADLDFETRLLGLNEAERARAIAQRQLETSSIDRRSEAYRRLQRTVEGIGAAAERNLVAKAGDDLDKLLGSIRKENDLIGATNAQRQYAGILRQLEVQGIREGTAAYEQLRAVLEQIRGELELGDQIARNQRLFEDMGQAVAGSFEDVLLGAKSAKEALRDLDKQLVALLSRRLVTEPLAAAITDILKGQLGGILGGSVGSGSSGGSGAAFGAIIGGIAANWGGGFAGGGYLRPGQWGVVGERGPELAYGGRTGATVLPSSTMRGGTSNTVINITVPGTTTRETANQVAGAVSRGLQLNRRRAVA